MVELKWKEMAPIMGGRQASEEDSGAVGFDVGVDPFGPSVQSLLVRLHGLHLRVHHIPFFIVILPDQH